MMNTSADLEDLKLTDKENKILKQKIEQQNLEI